MNMQMSWNDYANEPGLGAVIPLQNVYGEFKMTLSFKFIKYF